MDFHYDYRLASKQLILKKLQTNTMLTKEKLNRTVNNLPDSFTIDELIDNLITMEKIDEGLRQSEENKVISNEDVKLIIDKWSE